MIVWGAWAWGFPGTTRPAAFCARRAVMLSVFVRERARVSGAGATAGSRPRAPTSFGVGALHLPRAIVSGSLYGLLTRFCELALPGVRFAPVWPSTGRTARLAVVWWLYGVVAMLSRVVSVSLLACK